MHLSSQIIHGRASPAVEEVTAAADERNMIASDAMGKILAGIFVKFDVHHAAFMCVDLSGRAQVQS